jgi:hypothetical protein
VAFHIAEFRLHDSKFKTAQVKILSADYADKGKTELYFLKSAAICEICG